MRFIIRELPYEKPLAAGQMRYEINGRATGAVEKWRLTAAASGYRFLRVDLDARDAQSGDSYLYHLVLNDSGQPERLSYRFWGQALQVTGNVLLELGNLTSTRQVNGTRYEEMVEFAASCGFWFPSTIGLGLLGKCIRGGRLPNEGTTRAVTLNSRFNELSLVKAEAFALQATEVKLELGIGEELVVMGREVTTRPLTMCWQDQERTVWLDESNWPLKMVRGDGLSSVETRLIRYA
jgi:hypothetical protein